MIQLSPPSSLQRLVLAALATGFMLPALVACGSTKVMTASKTIVYDESIYNVTAVRELRPVREATLADGRTQSLRGMDARALRAFFEDQGEVRVCMRFMLDETSLEYACRRIDSYRDYARLDDRFTDARADIERFLGNRKRTQLDLD